jgi:hypothetical protein
MEAPVSLGENFENVGSGGFSKACTIFFGRRLAGGGERLNSLQATTGGGFDVFGGFHRTEHDRQPGSLLCSRPRLREKTSYLLRLILKERVVVSKRAISAIRGWQWVWMPRFYWAFGITRECNIKRYEK